MRRTASAIALVCIIGSLSCGEASAAENDCWIDAIEGSLICEASGGSTAPRPTTPRVRPPNRYVYESTDATGAACHYWSTIPGGIDTWEPANDPIVIVIVTTTPVCPFVAETPADIAWRIFRSFPLAIPDPSFEPPDNGITGLPTYVATADPSDITHLEVLPDGRTMEVWASVASLAVDWGDGAEEAFEPSQAVEYPSGGVTHTYVTKTCTAAYREGHPSGRNCHPTLEAYSVTASFVWAGRYRVGGAWIDLGTLTRSVTVPYDVDEVQGVLQP